MSDATNLEFQEAFRARVRELRGRRTQMEMAKLLGVEHDTYKKYENRSMMPHHLLAKFAMIVGADLTYLFTGIETARKGSRQTRVSEDEALVLSMDTAFADRIVQRPREGPSAAKQVKRD